MRDITLGDTIYIKFTTRAFATGIPTVLSGTPAVAAYVGSNLTQITAGVTLGVDHDGVVGLNLLTIVATSGNGFANATDIDLVITAGTVDSVSVVGEVVGSFTIGRSAAAVDLANGTDGLTALKTGIDGVPTTAEFDARTLLAADYFDPAVDAVATVTTLTNLPAIAAGWLTATGIAAGALDGKGNWNIGKTGYTLSQIFPANFADLAIEVTTGKVNGKTVDTCTTNSDMRGSDTAPDNTGIAAIEAAVVTNAAGVDISADVAAVKSDSAAILVDTGTTIPGIIDDLAIKKNATFSNFEFLMVLASDGRTPATGLTVTGQKSIDGAAFAAVSGVIAEVSNGIYQFDALAADTNGDVITWRFSSATADDAFLTFKTVQ